MKNPDKGIVSPEAARQIADIAGLDVDMDRAAELAPQIQSLRDSIDAMNKVDVTDVEPATVFPLNSA
jgi:Asp-tRNA(Asn)/Glu-tRNA(Gln) amidotransferase C subunit